MAVRLSMTASSSASTPTGGPDFQRLRRRLSATNAQAAARLAVTLPATRIVFDVLHLDDRALCALPYAERRNLLQRELPSAGATWRVPSALQGELDAVPAVTRSHELEGMAAQRLDSPNEPGRRSGAWLTRNHCRREAFAFTGWSPLLGTARRADAILIARAKPDGPDARRQRGTRRLSRPA